jgi:hypothetical protein
MFDCRAIFLNENQTANAILVGCCTAFCCCNGCDKRRAPTEIDKRDLAGPRRQLAGNPGGGMRDY